jgi:hypothetical protein
MSAFEQFHDDEVETRQMVDDAERHPNSPPIWNGFSSQEIDGEVYSGSPSCFRREPLGSPAIPAIECTVTGESRRESNVTLWAPFFLSMRIFL